MRKVLISVAPVSAAEKVIDPKKIAADVIACEKAGAGMVHLHVRDHEGNLTPDLTVFKETVERIREKSNIIIQASTGGISKLTIQQRCAPLYDDKVEVASLNVGSVNLGTAVYCNPIDEVKHCISEIQRMDKLPEIEVFEIGMIQTVIELRSEYPFKDPILFSIVLGHKGAAPATIEALTALRSFIPKDTLWGITHFGRKDYNIMSAALGMGAATVRIGFEDSKFLVGETEAVSNEPLVAKVAKIVRAMDCEPADPDEGRKMLNLSELKRGGTMYG